MGKDINGWVEVHETNANPRPWVNYPWHGVIKITELVGRSYDMFTSLFGVEPRYVDFDPIAPERGLPQDISVQS